MTIGRWSVNNWGCNPWTANPQLLLSQPIFVELQRFLKAAHVDFEWTVSAEWSVFFFIWGGYIVTSVTDLDLWIGDDDPRTGWKASTFGFSYRNLTLVKYQTWELHKYAYTGNWIGCPKMGPKHFWVLRHDTDLWLGSWMLPYAWGDPNLKEDLGECSLGTDHTMGH